MPGGRPHNLLVVSDLHLGEELLPGASADRRHAVALAAGAFIEFLRHHQRTRLDGRPWRLVINGDLFDFMSVDRGPIAPGADRLARTPAQAVVQLRAIALHHRAVLGQLASFVAAGHRVDIIAGNHDRELIWPEVGAALRAELLALAPRGLGAAELEARVGVHPWFVHEPGVAWIEHGDRYDEQCAAEYALAPEDPRTGALGENVDYAAFCTLGHAAPDLDIHGTEGWSFGGFMRYGWGRGVRPLCTLLASYGHFVRRLLAARGLHRSPRLRRQRAERHARARAALAGQAGLPDTTLAALDELASAPITASARRLARLLMLDRWVAMLATVLALVVAFVALTPALATVTSALAGLAIWTGAGRLAGGDLASQLPMQRVPAAIRDHVGVPVVVFGHTHAPLRQVLPGGGVYVNSGTWLPAIRPGLLRAFTHVAIVGGVAELRQWRDGASRRFEPRDPTPVPRPVVTPRPVPVRPPAPAAAAVAARSLDAASAHDVVEPTSAPARAA